MNTMLKSLQPLLAALLLALSVCVLSGCGRPHGDMATLAEYSIDNSVRTSPVAVGVKPLAPLERHPRVLFMPLRVRQEVAHHVTLGREVSRQIWQEWLSMRLFSVMQFAEESGPWNANSALAQGRKLGAELVVGGYVNSYLDGGTEGKSSASIQLEIYEVRSGTMLFSLAQAGLIEKIPARDYYLFSVKERMPLDPAALVVRTLARGMGQKVQEWTQTPEERRQRAKDGSWLKGIGDDTAF